MSELDLLRSLPLDVDDPDADARARARGRLLRHIRHGRPAHRRRLLVPAVALAAAGAAAALIGVGVHGDGNASAATALRHAAAVARRQAPPAPLPPGHYVYSKSVQAFLVIDGDKGWAALGPKVREVWIGRHGGLLHETNGKPEFLSARDREHWIAAGRPPVNAPEATEKLEPTPPLDLPTDPDALFAKLRVEAEGNANGVDAEMFTLVGDALRETNASPALRASLYEVAARIPGVELLGPTTDRVGRRGVAVAYSSSHNHERYELIFDPRTSALLEEQTVELDGNFLHYPAGTVTGYATYVSTGVVDRAGQRP
jgi:RNA polymerase sigma-70 factor (ECF subfamily)